MKDKLVWTSIVLALLALISFVVSIICIATTQITFGLIFCCVGWSANLASQFVNWLCDEQKRWFK